MFKMSTITISSRSSRSELLEKAIEKGQELRDSLVATILKNEPVNNFNDLPTDKNDTKILNLYLKGYNMSRKDELKALDILKSMSAEDLCRTTNDAFNSCRTNCSCITCFKYQTQVNCDIKTSKTKPDSDLLKYFKFVDCLKIIVYDLTLTDNGLKKIKASLSFDKQALVGNQTFFIEYELPFILNPNVKKVVPPVRICSKRLSSDVVHFKQTSTHDVKNLDMLNLDHFDIKFNVSCRIFKQKTAIPFGCAVFNMSEFESSSAFTCNKEIPVRISDDNPLKLGSVRVTLQMGCGRLYYGKEFLDAILSENLPADFQIESQTQDNEEKSVDFVPPTKHPKEKNKEKPKLEIIKKDPKLPPNKIKIIEKPIKIDNSITKKEEVVKVVPKQILFGFIYVSEANFVRNPVNCYFTCKSFCQDETSTSKLTNSENRSVFNFYQLVPLLYEEKLILSFRENVMNIEFWEKFGTKEVLFGVTKLPLNQFYVAYRNPEVTTYLSKNQFPIISSDWWEAIYNPYTEEIVGQIQVLLALGTDSQIKNLEIDRGFKSSIVRARPVLPLKQNQKPAEKIYRGKFQIPHRNEQVVYKGIQSRKVSKESQTTNELKTNKGIQSDPLDMDKGADKSDKFEMFLSTLMSMQEKAKVRDNSTNTANEGTSVQKTDKEEITDDVFKVPEIPKAKMLPRPSNVKSTSELLANLQDALSVDNIFSPKESSKISFKARVNVIKALHLPSRRKSKTKKRGKVKTVKNDEVILPSCYVTFETMPGVDINITNLVQRSTSPQWNYESDVHLPSELLFNNNKKLIFKVWRKSTGTTMVPNLLNDVILGFATLDLTVLLSGFPNIQGWFHINDLTGKCHGQVNIHITPLEDLDHFKKHKGAYKASISPPLIAEEKCEAANVTYSVLEPNDPFEEGDLLSRALKRKFTELEEITERLRCRLSDVTKEDSEENDEFADEFERDLNSVSFEEDLINLDKEESPSCLNVLQNQESVSSPNIPELSLSGSSMESQNTVTNINNYISLDQQLFEGKQRIDALLGKLSLISNENSSRYVSGCSATSDSRHRAERFHNDNSNKHSSESSSSVFSDLGNVRAAPDGEGIIDHLKPLKKP